MKGRLSEATMFSLAGAWQDGGREAQMWGSLSTSWFCRQWGAGGVGVQQQHPPCTEGSTCCCHRWMAEKTAVCFAVILHRHCAPLGAAITQKLLAGAATFTPAPLTAARRA